jgi:hypothetical protein
MSITGRNMILQSKFLGSFRYWLYSLIMPDTITHALESDSKAFLWAGEPGLHANEIGTSNHTRRYMIEHASYLPQKSGGAGVMHWHSHVEAFYAQWILKYMDPRQAPWKEVLDYWIADHWHEGRHIFIAKLDGDASIAGDIPPSLPYIAKCVRAWERIRPQKQYPHYTLSAGAESLFHNNNFSIPLPHHSITQWQQHVRCTAVNDMFDPDTHETYTARQWDTYFYTHAPRALRHTPEAHEWVENRHAELNTILNSIPDAIKAALDDSNVDDYQYFSLVDHNGVHKQWVERTLEEDGSTLLHEIILDVSGFPHRTGKPGNLQMLHPIPALVWEEQPSDSEDEIESGRPQPEQQQKVRRQQIVGPITTAQPDPRDWKLKGASAPKYITKATTIKNITLHKTTELIGNIRPNCEHNWSHAQAGVRTHIVSYPLHWPTIWRSLGTPLSNATEERIWRKLLHRALDVRNKHKELTDQKCRCGCGEVESMLHLAQCRYILPFWNACLDFIETVLKHKQSVDKERAIIFGQTDRRKMLPVPALALLRHGWQNLYRHFTLVETRNQHLSWRHIFLDTLRSFRSAVLRVKRTITLQRTSVKHGKRPIRPPPQQIINPLLVHAPDGNPYHLSNAFAQALRTAEANHHL